MDLDAINLSDMPDSEVAACMRTSNYEKYKTLVRMHLSFELDLNTDEFDLPCHEIVYEDKGKLKKWNRMSKKYKIGGSSCAAYGKNAASAGNSPTEGLQQQIDAGFMFHLQELKDFLLLEKNLTQEGIFRKTGSASRQNELRLQIQNEKPLELDASGYTAHDCATVFKGYLAELPEPLLTDAHYPAHLQIAPLCLGTTLHTAAAAAGNDSFVTKKSINPERLKREQHLLNSMQLLLLLLPDENRQLTQHVIEMLHAVTLHAEANKMSPENLATLFAPHLICPRNLPPEALHYVAKKMSSIIAYMIYKGAEIFEVPAKLSTDIRAYFLERRRKKTMSPEHTLDDSISDISTVNTVYTFVDRERTAAAHTANNTDTELAQLYAHIQSLPESSKKRRLIKQFNKQNGQGTPLQLVVMNRLKNSEATRSAKSISDSIKKHIFHKGIMSRTPKRANLPVSIGMETPTSKNPKLRVLFQSPAPSVSQLHTTVAATTAAATTTSASSYTSSTTCASTTITTITITSSCKSLSPARSSNNSPFIIKKSNSACYLNASLTRACRQTIADEEAINVYSSSSISSCSSDGFTLQRPKSTKSTSVSAPVSRQTSTDLSAAMAKHSHSCSTSSAVSHNFPLLDTNCCITPLKMISEAAKHLIGVKKNVAWDEQQLLDIEEISNPSTPSSQTASGDFKSRYKSEPNLSHIHKDKLSNEMQENTPIQRGKLLTCKLIKGVSMGNLKFPFGTPEVTKRLVRKQQLHKSNDAANSCYVGPAAALCADELLETEDDDDEHDLDDVTFEDDPKDHLDDEVEDIDEKSVDRAVAAAADVVLRNKSDDDNSLVLGGSSSSELNGSTDACSTSNYQHVLHNSGVYRHLDLMSNTPSLLLSSRRSMSPITKSTQRMPKAMQESIMTPRSRKPVMMLTNTLGGSDQNQTICQTDLESFREQDEDSIVTVSVLPAIDFQPIQEPLNINEDALDGYSETLEEHSELLDNNMFQKQNTIGITTPTDCVQPNDAALADALTNNFKEYLLSRSVRTASPVDSSFSSQPDDFASSSHDIDDLNESQLNPSLLYCLNGNQPEEEEIFTECHNESNASQTTETINEINNVASTTSSIAISDSSSRINRLSSNPFIIVNNARKRAATCDVKSPKINNFQIGDGSNISNETMNDTSGATKKVENKENYENAEGYLLSKKLLIREYPGETSF